MNISKKKIEEAINDNIAVVYLLKDNIRIACKVNDNKEYHFNEDEKYLIITAKSFYTVENLKLKEIHPFK